MKAEATIDFFEPVDWDEVTTRRDCREWSSHFISLPSCSSFFGVRAAVIFRSRGIITPYRIFWSDSWAWSNSTVTGPLFSEYSQSWVDRVRILKNRTICWYCAVCLNFVLCRPIYVRPAKWSWRDLYLSLQMHLYQQLAKSRFCCATNLQPNFMNLVLPLAARMLLVPL